jgi:hypothetical protein
MPEELVRAPVYEVGISASGAGHGQIRIFGARGFFVNPVLDELPARRTSEDDVGHCRTIGSSLGAAMTQIKRNTMGRTRARPRDSGVNRRGVPTPIGTLNY